MFYSCYPVLKFGIGKILLKFFMKSLMLTKASFDEIHNTNSNDVTCNSVT